MPTDKEIFETYALKRLSEGNPMLDDFPSQASESLAYLSLMSGVAVLPPNDTYLKTETDQFGENQKYYVENITDVELIKKRAQNIEKMTANFSSVLVKKIKRFEEYTKYLHTSELSTPSQIYEDLKKAARMFKSDGKEQSKIKILLNKEAAKLKPKIQSKKTNTPTKKEQMRNTFYGILQNLHKTPSIKDRFNKYITLWHLAPYADPQDLKGFAYETPFQTTPDLKKRFTTELRRDILEKLYPLSARFSSRDVIEGWYNMLKKYNKACSHFSSINEKGQRRLLGQTGAFEKGGLYGPDSKFANPSENKKEIDLSLFSPKDLEY